MTPQQLRYLVLITAAQARIFGMVASNQSWAARGEGPAYYEDHFQAEANELERLAQEIAQQ